MALGTSAAYGLSVYLLFQHAGHGTTHLSVEASLPLSPWCCCGKWLKPRETSDSYAIRDLNALRPTTARVRRHGEELEVQLSRLVEMC